MDAFGFNTPSYGAPSSGLNEILQWLKKEDVVEGDATEPAGEYYRKAQEKKLRTFQESWMRCRWSTSYPCWGLPESVSLAGSKANAFV